MTITPLREIQLHWTDIFESYQISCSSCQELGLCEWESICSWVQNLSPFLSCSWNNQNRSVQKLSSEKADGEQSPVSAPIVNWCESQPRHPLPALGGRRRRKGFLQWDSSCWFLNHLRIHTGCIAICLSWHDFSIADCWDRLDLIDSQCLWEGSAVIRIEMVEIESGNVPHIWRWDSIDWSCMRQEFTFGWGQDSSSSRWLSVWIGLNFGSFLLATYKYKRYSKAVIERPPEYGLSLNPTDLHFWYLFVCQLSSWQYVNIQIQKT